MMLSKYLRIPQYKAEGYPKEQLDKIQDLFSKAYGGRTLSVGELQWQMERNPCLKERAVSLWQNETLIAYNALTPFPAVLRGKEIIAAVSGTTMVDENFPGITLQLAAELVRNNEDIGVIIGFPNHNIFKISVKYLHHHHVGNVAFWMTDAREKKVSPGIHEFTEFSGEYEAISRELGETHNFIKIRNSDFLNWRFFQRPGYQYRGFEYEKHGYLVVDTYMEKGVRQLQVIDILADSKEVMNDLLIFAVNLAYEWHCSVLKLWFTSKYYEKILTQNGFTYGEHPFPMVVWDQDLDISDSYITMGDSDIF